jgi:putative MATE family efflux protein
MLTRKHLLNVITLGAPLLVGMVSEFFMYMADSAMVGRLGTEHLAAIGFATLFAEVLWVIVWPFAPGTQALAARRFGKLEAMKDGDSSNYRELQQKIGEVLDNSLIISFAVGAVTIFLASYSREILGLLLGNSDLIPLAHAYIRIVKWVMPLAAVFFSVYGLLAAIKLTRVIMVATVSVNVLNIVFNYILIFGKFGIPAMGIEGAAIGTVTSQALGTVLLLAYVIFSGKLRGYRCCRFRNIHGRMMKDIVVVSSPMIAQLGVSLCIFIYYESIIAGIGTVYLAVTHIVLTTFVLNRCLVEGFAEGGSILIGNQLGRGDRKEALQYAYATECIALCLGTVLLLLVLIFPEMIVSVFNTEAATVAAGVSALRFFAGFLFVAIIGFPFEVIFTHNGWGRYALFAELLPIVTFTLGLTLLVTNYLGMGIYAAWLSLGLYMVIYSALLVGGFFSKKWLDVSVEGYAVKDLRHKI